MFIYNILLKSNLNASPENGNSMFVIKILKKSKLKFKQKKYF